MITNEKEAIFKDVGGGFIGDVVLPRSSSLPSPSPSLFLSLGLFYLHTFQLSSRARSLFLFLSLSLPLSISLSLSLPSAFTHTKPFVLGREAKSTITARSECKVNILEGFFLNILFHYHPFLKTKFYSWLAINLASRVLEKRLL